MPRVSIDLLCDLNNLYWLTYTQLYQWGRMSVPLCSVQSIQFALCVASELSKQANKVYSFISTHMFRISVDS